MKKPVKKDPFYELITALINQANGPVHRQLIMRSIARKAGKK